MSLREEGEALPTATSSEGAYRRRLRTSLIAAAFLALVGAAAGTALELYALYLVGIGLVISRRRAGFSTTSALGHAAMVCGLALAMLATLSLTLMAVG